MIEATIINWVLHSSISTSYQVYPAYMKLWWGSYTLSCKKGPTCTSLLSIICISILLIFLHFCFFTIIHCFFILSIYFNSFKISHIHNDLATLSLHIPYNGNDTLTIGDGTSLPISHIGCISLHTPSFSFVVLNALYVPRISCKIISLSLLCRDNNILINFVSSTFLIKDLFTNQVLLKGNVNGGIYDCSFNSSSPCVATTSSSTIWHHRLGHPTHKIQHLISSSISSFISSNPSTPPCNSCNINK